MTYALFMIGYLAGGVVGSWIGWSNYDWLGLWIGGFVGGFLCAIPLGGVGLLIDKIRGAL
jgi:hypothetical protein